MTTFETFQTASNNYTQHLQSFFTPPNHERGTPVEGRERSILATTNLDATDALVDSSRAFNTSAQTYLEHNARARGATDLQLLVKAVSDLQAGNVLYEAAQQDALHDKGHTRKSVGASERGIEIVSGRDLDEVMAILRGEPMTTNRAMTERGATALTRETAQDELSGLVGLAFQQISKSASSTSLSALSGITSLGVSETLHGLGVVGFDLAKLLGVSEQVSRYYTLCRDLVGNAYQAITNLIGAPLLKMAIDKGLGWLDEVNQNKDKYSVELIEKVYATQLSKTALNKLISGVVMDDDAVLGKFKQAYDGVDALNTAFAKRMKYVDYAMKGLTLAKMIPAAALPQGKVLMGAGYLLLGAYTVLAGADYVDAESLKLVRFVDGVPSVVKTRLG